MKDIQLSTAMREGAKLRPQNRYYFFSKDTLGRLCSCALGASYEYMYGDIYPGVVNTEGMASRLGIEDIFTDHPITDRCASMVDIIADLNDRQEWTREQIADWLESLGF